MSSAVCPCPLRSEVLKGLSENRPLWFAGGPFTPVKPAIITQSLRTVAMMSVSLGLDCGGACRPLLDGQGSCWKKHANVVIVNATGTPLKLSLLFGPLASL